MKKGLEWEVIPERREAVEREMELYQENRYISSDRSNTLAVTDSRTENDYGEMVKFFIRGYSESCMLVHWCLLFLPFSFLASYYLILQAIAVYWLYQLQIRLLHP